MPNIRRFGIIALFAICSMSGSDISASIQRNPFSGLALTAFWQLAWPSNVAPNAYLANYADLTGRGNTLQSFPNAATGNSSANFNVGANNAGGQVSTAYFAHFGTWSRKLTLTEQNDLNGGDICSGSAPCSYTLTSLNVGLKCYWAFGEVSGTSAHHSDTSGNSCPDLVDAGSSTQVAGPNGGADKATYYFGGSYATSGASASTDPGTGDYSYFIAVNMQALSPGTESVFNCQFDLAQKRGSVCGYYQGLGASTLNTDHDNGIDLARNGVVVNTQIGAPSAGTWYRIGYSFDSTAGVETMYVNGTSNAGTFDRTYVSSPFTFTPLSCYSRDTFDSSWDCSSTGASPGLKISDPTSDLGFSGVSRTWGFWVNAVDTAASNVQFLAGTVDNETREAHLAAEVLSGTVYMISGTAGANNFQYCSSAITDGLHFLLYYYNSTDSSQHAFLDNVPFTSCMPVTFTPTVGTLPFFIGVTYDPGAAYGVSLPVASGTQISRMFFANGIPTATDMAILYASGNGWQLQ